MGKILVVDDEEDILEILEIILNSEFDNQIIFANSGNEGVRLLDIYDDIDVILADYNMPDGNGSVVFDHNRVNKNLPFFLVTGGYLSDYEDMKDFQAVNPHNLVVQKPIDEDFLIKSLKRVLQETDSEIVFSVNKDQKKTYKRIKIDNIRRHKEITPDVYIKISDEKFVKIINANEFQECEQLQKYSEKGEDFVYVTDEDFKDFSAKVTEKLLKQIQSIEEGETEVFESVADGLNYLNDSLRQIGVSQAQIVLVNATVSASISKLQKIKSLEKYMEGIFIEKGYLVSHSITAIHMSYLIAKKLGFNSENILKKLTYAAIMHDIMLDSAKLSEVIDFDSARHHELTEKEIEKIKGHPREAFDLVSGVDEFPNEVAHIVFEHHEKPDGSGFPRGLAANRISPLGCIFILALKVSDFLYFNKFAPETVKDLRKELEEYKVGNFKRAVDALLDILSKMSPE